MKAAKGNEGVAVARQQRIHYRDHHGDVADGEETGYAEPVVSEKELTTLERGDGENKEASPV